MPRLGALVAGGAAGLVDPTVATALLHFFTNPLVVPILLALGVIGIVFEAKAGAHGLGALISVVSLGLFFGSAVMLGLAGWEEVILLGLGALALGVELFILPGFGVAGVLGIGFIVGATVLALVGGSPSTADVAGAFGVLGASLVVTGAVFFAWLRHLPNSHRFAGLLLHGGVARGEGFISAPQRDDLVGQLGVTLTDLRPSGTAIVAGERMDVVTEGEFIVAGAAITVIRAEGYRHIVRLAHDVTNHLPPTSAPHE